MDDAPAETLAELLAASERYRQAEAAIRSVAGYAPDSRIDARRAIGAALVAHALGGVISPVPERMMHPCVITPAGGRVFVWVTDAHLHGLAEGFPIGMVDPRAELVALLAMNAGVPLAVHVMDRVCAARVAEHLYPTQTTSPRPMLGSFMLNFMLHVNLTWEPLRAEVLGVRTIWFAPDDELLGPKVDE